MKIAILWNGKWHYENIMGDLKQIQNRDKIKYDEIVSFGYMPYIITDLGRFSKVKCEVEFKRFEEFLSLLNRENRNGVLHDGRSGSAEPLQTKEEWATEAIERQT